ncbi:TIM barrel protein [Carnobacterium sp. CS13]|uniref:sugar phosphate isomerase/epimerase family protein n=1 Tax=Carnobacterium sp. CS13 TaxID=2800128 RepID=UPI00191189C9|nr:TIM barrel protein [Carnobacterium sp. CS13]QQP70697.1 TIM barrel protein [Carnobacterium sp. CS13]
MIDKGLVLNMLVFAGKVQNGAVQSDLIEESVALGFRKIEVRREYFKNLANEMADIKKLVEKYELELFYSVPDEVFVDGKVNSKLGDYLLEAIQMGITHIKWNIGDFAGFTGDLRELKPLTEQGIEVNIENDQTQTSGTISAIDTFMKAVEEEGLTIGYVYDLGNWRFVGEDEKIAAEQLGKYVSYIHVKDVIYMEGKPQAVGLDHGEIDWREILSVLPGNVPVAIEYPTTEKQEILDAKALLEEE